MICVGKVNINVVQSGRTKFTSFVATCPRCNRELSLRIGIIYYTSPYFKRSPIVFKIELNIGVDPAAKLNFPRCLPANPLFLPSSVFSFLSLYIRCTKTNCHVFRLFLRERYRRNSHTPGLAKN